jgi:hypothetical protein
MRSGVTAHNRECTSRARLSFSQQRKGHPMISFLVWCDMILRKEINEERWAYAYCALLSRFWAFGRELRRLFMFDDVAVRSTTLAFLSIVGASAGWLVFNSPLTRGEYRTCSLLVVCGILAFAFLTRPFVGLVTKVGLR